MRHCLITFLTKKGNKKMAKYVTCLRVLMTLAIEVGRARLSEDPVRLEEAERNLKSYEKRIKTSDKVLIGMTRGQLSL